MVQREVSLGYSESEVLGSNVFFNHHQHFREDRKTDRRVAEDNQSTGLGGMKQDTLNL